MKKMWKKYSKNKMSVLGFVIIVLLLILVIFADLYIGYDKVLAQDVKNKLQSPSLSHICGTDNLGRDLFARLIYGARVSLGIGVAATFAGMMIGCILGAACAYIGGKVENLRVGFGEEEKREVVRNISFQIKKGEVLCLVGESGSGKSVTAFSIMQLFHGTTGMILGGKILVNGTNLAELSEKEMQKRRGNEIAMVFQEPMTSLNPVITIGVQMARAMRLHQKLEKQKVREKSIQLLEKVGIKHAEKTLYAYPHEVSGGMRQRIMIAMAMINKPSLLIVQFQI